VLLWTAALLSNTGSWMHDAAAGWLMTTLDRTPSMVALRRHCRFSCWRFRRARLPTAPIGDNC
jgi:hypothetical protein